MREFFRHWRRNVVCVLLVCDCALVSLWLASRQYRMSVLVRVTKSMAVGAETRQGYLACVLHDAPEWARETVWWDFAPSVAVRSMEQFAGMKLLRLLNLPLVGIVSPPTTNATMNGVIIWIPSLILPLTMVSASLLLWPRRRRFAFASLSGPTVLESSARPCL